MVCLNISSDQLTFFSFSESSLSYLRVFICSFVCCGVHSLHVYCHVRFLGFFNNTFTRWVIIMLIYNAFGYDTVVGVASVDDDNCIILGDSCIESELIGHASCAT